MADPEGGLLAGALTGYLVGGALADENTSDAELIGGIAGAALGGIGGGFMGGLIGALLADDTDGGL